jgi:hypothetical protein
LKQAKEEALEKLQVAQQEKDDMRAKFEEERENMEEETTEIQVGKLTKAIQQLQARVAELELQAVPSTPQEVQDQREEIARSTV